MDLVAQHIAAGGLTVSVGSGSFLLAETGLMAGRSMTTHWQWFDAFLLTYPSVSLGSTTVDYSIRLRLLREQR